MRGGGDMSIKIEEEEKTGLVPFGQKIKDEWAFFGLWTKKEEGGPHSHIFPQLEEKSKGTVEIHQHHPRQPNTQKLGRDLTWPLGSIIW